jgi:mannonate dehydratase
MREMASGASMMGMPPQGTVAEMLDDPAREIFEVIRWFGERAKIFNVHFRNIKGHKLDFMEAFPDEGDIDMPRALAAYRDVGYPYMLMPDHVPQIDGPTPRVSPSPIATATSRRS